MKTILDLEEIKAKIKASPNMQKIVNESGVSRQNLYNMLGGNDPRYSTVKQLSDYFTQE